MKSDLAIAYSKPDKALDTLNKLISMDPHFAEAYWYRHETYSVMGKHEEANEDKIKAEKFSYYPIS